MNLVLKMKIREGGIFWVTIEEVWIFWVKMEEDENRMKKMNEICENYKSFFFFFFHLVSLVIFVFETGP